MSKQYIAQMINKSESDFEGCWEVLEALKGADIPDRIKRIINFQSDLAVALHRLERLYREVCQCEDRLIRRKSHVSKTWFAKRMKTLSHYKKGITFAIGVGKSLGDAFAWTFYQKDRTFLAQHYTHKNEFHGPTGIGGIGELEFIKRVKHVSGMLVIYHGTTTFLTLGDITLVDLKTMKVGALGELKTEQLSGNKIQITIHLLGPGISPANLPPISIDGSATPKPLPASMQARLQRQMKRIEKSFEAHLKTKEDFKIDIRVNNQYSDLQRLLTKTKYDAFEYQKSGKSVFLVAYKDRRKSLSTRFLSESVSTPADKRSPSDPLP